jgi:hypothetical protein
MHATCLSHLIEPIHQGYFTPGDAAPAKNNPYINITVLITLKTITREKIYGKNR